MARALIQINGSDSRFTTVTIGTTVQLANNDEGGESTYAWSIVDQPEGTADNLSSASIENPTFVPTKEGSYQVRLIVNASLPTQDLQTAIVAVLDARTAQRYPAATESDEASTARGWSQALNRLLKQAMVAASDANLVVAQTPGSIAAGAIVKFSALGTISSGTQAQFDSLKIAAVNGTVSVSGRLGIVIDGVVPGDLAVNKLVVVRVFGLVPFSVAGAPTVGDPVFLSNAGIASLTPGTVPRPIGVVVSVGGGNFRWAIDGAPPGGLADGSYGDIAVSGGGTALTIAADAVTNAKLANVPTATFKARATAGTGDSEDLSVTQAQTLLALAAIATSGSGADLTANSVTNAKLAQMAANTVKANLTGGSATPSDATVASLATAVGSQMLAGAGYFGDGSDGAADFDGVNNVTGWTRVGSRYFPTSRPSWYFTTVTLANGVSLEMEIGGEGSGGGCSSELYASVAISIPTGSATIKHNGATPTTNVVATNMVTGHTGATVGQGSGGVQNAGQNGVNFAGNWYNARKAGAGGFGGASPTAAGSTAGGAASTTLPDAVGLPCTLEQARAHRLNSGNPGAASGGGGGGSGAGTVGVASGGAGGNGGGVMTVGARNVTGAGSLSIQVKGGNGAPGVAALGSNAGGGSGGGGGEVTAYFGTSSVPAGVTIDKSGGTGGAPQGTGNAGGNGVDGQERVLLLGPG